MMRRRERAVADATARMDGGIVRITGLDVTRVRVNRRGSCG